MVSVFWNQIALTATRHRECTSDHFKMIETVTLTLHDFHLDYFLKK